MSAALVDASISCWLASDDASYGCCSVHGCCFAWQDFITVAAVLGIFLCAQHAAAVYGSTVMFAALAKVQSFGPALCQDAECKS